MNFNADSAHTTPIATTPLTIMTPPNEIIAERSGMRVCVVHTQK